jgi:hypothetical protein
MGADAFEALLIVDLQVTSSHRPSHEESVQYDATEYRRHLAAVQSMREAVEEKLSSLGGYSVVLSDSMGAIPVKEETDDWRAIRADLSAATVNVESSMPLERLHKVLTDRGVPNEYKPQAPGTLENDVIRLSIDDAITHLRSAVAQVKADSYRSSAGQNGPRSR